MPVQASVVGLILMMSLGSQNPISVGHQTGGDLPISQPEFIWDGRQIPQTNLALLRPDDTGTVEIPVFTREGKLSSFWETSEGEAITGRPEAGNTSGLSLSGAASSMLAYATKLTSTTTLRSKFFPITQDMRRIGNLGVIGGGTIDSTYIVLTVSADGGAPVEWAKQAPSSPSSFDSFEVDLSKLQEKVRGKSTVGRFEVVDASTDHMIGIGGIASRHDDLSTRTDSRTAHFIPSSIYLGPRAKRFNDFVALIEDGRRHARFFGLKPIESEAVFGMPESDMFFVLTEVNKLVAGAQFDHNPLTWKHLPKRLTEAAVQVSYRHSKALGHNIEQSNGKADFEYFISLTAIQEWFRTRFRYDDEIAHGRAPRIDFRPAMSSADPRGVCGDLSWGVVHFAALAGLDNVYKVEGSCRASNGRDHSFTHSWNAATLPSGVPVFFDPTRNHFTITQGVRARNGMTFSPFSLGPSDWNSGFFLYYYHNQTIITGRKTSNDVEYVLVTERSRQLGTTLGIDFFTGMTWEKWYSLVAPRSFDAAHRHFFLLFDGS